MLNKRAAAMLLAVAVAVGVVGEPAAASAAAPTGAVTVMVLSTSGKKLPEPNLFVTIYGPPLVYEYAFTTAHGRATFSGVRPGKNYTVLVEQRGDHGKWTRLSATKTVTVVAGHHVWVAVTMRIAASISGRITDQTGAPVAGETVKAFGLTSRQNQPAVTNANGEYTIRKLVTDSWKLTAFNSDGTSKVFRAGVTVEAQHGSVAQSEITGQNTIVTRP